MKDRAAVVCGSELCLGVCFAALTTASMLTFGSIWETNVFIPFRPAATSYDILPVASITAENFSAAATAMSTTFGIKSTAPAGVSSVLE